MQRIETVHLLEKNGSELGQMKEIDRHVLSHITQSKNLQVFADLSSPSADLARLLAPVVNRTFELLIQSETVRL